MITLEYKYLQIIKEIKNLKETEEKNIFIKPTIWLYKWMVKRRNKLLEKQFLDGLIKKKAFDIWNKMLLKAIST